jgi:hypothetical protein
MGQDSSTVARPEAGQVIKSYGQSPYQYQPLKPERNEIRVLQVARGKRSDEVRCRLVHVSLDSNYDYNALSYTWGRMTKPSYIIVDNRSFPVTENLFTAISWLRSPIEELTIWIDAVCINQQDDVERNEQVSKMRSIYERASHVFMWLQEPSDDSHLAFVLIRDVASHLRAGRDIADFVKQWHETPGRLKQFQALNSLLQRDYWYRVWVIQEVKSASYATVHCGPDTADLQDLSLVQEAFLNSQGTLASITLKDPSLKGFRTTIQLRGPYGLKVLAGQISPELPTLFEAVVCHRHKKSTLPEDRIYSLVGVTSARSNFKIDYKRETRQIYIDMAAHTITTDHKLDIICSMQKGNDTFNLPSWVPSWFNDKPNALLFVESHQLHRYKAAGLTAPEAHVHIDENILVVKGFRLGTIHRLGSKTGVGMMDDDEDLSSMIQAFHQWRSVLASNQGSKTPELGSFGRTLTCDLASAGSFERYGTDSFFVQAILGAFPLISHTQHPEITLDQQLASLATEFGSRWNDGLAEYRARVVVLESRSLFFQRRFFISYSGMVGLAGEEVLEGDVICVLFGCSLPVILRPVGDHFIYVGEAYADGYMWGRAIEELDEGAYEVREFEIH